MSIPRSPGTNRWHTERRTKASLVNGDSITLSPGWYSRESSLLELSSASSMHWPRRSSIGSSSGSLVLPSVTSLSATTPQSPSGTSSCNLFAIRNLPEREFSEEEFSDDEAPGAYAITRWRTQSTDQITDDVDATREWDPTEQEQAANDSMTVSSSQEFAPGTNTRPIQYLQQGSRTPSRVGMHTLLDAHVRRSASKWQQTGGFMNCVIVITVGVILGIGVATLCLFLRRKGEISFDATEDPLSANQCNFLYEENPDPFLQCDCFSNISKFSAATEAQYRSLKTYHPFFEQADSGLPINACVSENIALVWVSMEIAEMRLSAVDQLHLTNRFTLVFLYSAWVGMEWNDSSQWASDTSECSWYGVKCDAMGNVMSLSLEMNNLVGTIETRIGLLTKLNALDLNDNHLRGAIPEEVWKLPELEDLSLGNNLLDGSLPSNLGDSTALTRLSLFHNDIGGSIPDGIVQASNLKVLDIHNSNISGSIPIDLGSLVELEYLDLSDTDITEHWPESLSSLANLKHLLLTIDGLSGTIPDSIGRMTALEELQSDFGDLVGTIPSTIGLLTNLERLSLTFLEVSGSIPSEIGMCTKLESLDLHGNDLDESLPAELGQLRALSRLDVSYNVRLEGTVPHEYDVLPSIRCIFLQQTSITGAIPSGICEDKKVTLEIKISPSVESCSCCETIFF